MSHLQSPQVVNPDTMRSVLGRFASGVTVVTGLVNDQPLGMTIQSFLSLSLEPPLVLISVARTSSTWPLLRLQGQFAVNILGETQAGVASSFGRRQGKTFDGVPWRPGPATGSPVLKNAVAWIEAEIWQTYDGGDHEIAVARVLDLGTEDYESSPLLFYRSGFTALAHTDAAARTRAHCNKDA
ncbi:flavin reductase family protein [Arthrobacter sp. Alg241-R88]|uniref:flavin reductase family protein n=1 Tax=Arthrobacter sp. Alg241-R88 TaxID=2305984 RepID=UPI0013D06453|nr:flavin reductase family protein [Arthrobacter sp. Alg241-R88]